MNSWTKKPPLIEGLAVAGDALVKLLQLDLQLKLMRAKVQLTRPSTKVDDGGERVE